MFLAQNLVSIDDLIPLADFQLVYESLKNCQY